MAALELRPSATNAGVGSDSVSGSRQEPPSAPTHAVIHVLRSDSPDRQRASYLRPTSATSATSARGENGLPRCAAKPSDSACARSSARA